ncbi:hypothetical protein [Bradyrhizobium sp. WSM1417]|uniref:hypothetical protein n=1 Tax=Bradyrhizobium sp. WSM1417 TaxID=754500 RepID=UPI000482A07B|nr:hypothetical protein [Bradyrhizobium sp. WSM1417]
MKLLKERSLDNPVCRFTLANLDEVLLPYLEARDDEAERKRSLAPFIARASRLARRFGPLQLAEFYVEHILWTICMDAADCDEDFPGRWWGAWRSARLKIFEYVAKEMAPAIESGEFVQLDEAIAAVTERYLDDDERFIVERLTAWHTGEGPVLSLLFREWQTHSSRRWKLEEQQWEQEEQERREQAGSKEDQLARLEGYLDEAITPHLTALVGRYRKLIKTGAYGEKIIKGWEKEVRYFSDEVLELFERPEVRYLERADVEAVAYEHITERVEAAVGGNPYRR